MHDGGFVKVVAAKNSENAKMVNIAIIDSSCGIPVDAIALLFERFL